MKKVLFLVNHDLTIYNFRLEIIERLLSDGYEVAISSPYGDKIDKLVQLGCSYYPIEIERHGMNPIKELKLLHDYQKQMEEIRPDYVCGFTIKPNIYGALAAGQKNIPFIANITGLGVAVESPGLRQRILVGMYKLSFRKVQRVFLQNEANRQFFIDHKIAVSKHAMLPGSGVNLQRFAYKPYPSDGVIKFAFLCRIMKEKGIDEYLEMAKQIKLKFPHTEFHICGFCETDYEGILAKYHADGTVIYHGMIRDVARFLDDIHCVVHPTFYPEGISNVLLEAAATGRPIITTDRAGCREVVDDGINGYMIPQRDTKKLIEAVDRFLCLSNQEREAMGRAAREKVERQFDRRIVVDRYIKELESL